LLLSIGVQSTFIYQLWGMLDDPWGEDSIDSLRQWRLFEGHSIQNLDWASGSTLTSRTCSESHGIWAERPFGPLTSDLRRYISNSVEGHHILSVLAVFVWVLTVVKEFVRGGALAAETCSLLDSTTSVAHDRHDERKLTIESVSTWRLAATLALLVLPRAAVAGMLGYVGVLYIVRTTTVERLLLNVLVLNFIFDLPALLFAAMTSQRIRVVAGMVAFSPPSRAHQCRWFRCCRSACVPLAALVLVAGTVALVDAFEITSAVSAAHEALGVLCGGRKDFAFSYDRSTGLVYAAGTPSWPGHDAASRTGSSNDNANMRAYAYQSLLATSGLGEGLPSGAVELPLMLLADLHELSRQELTDEMASGGCADQLGGAISFGTGTLSHKKAEALRHLLRVGFNLQVSTCKDIMGYCRSESALNMWQSNGMAPELIDRAIDTLRSICPITCGCGDPLSGIYALSGCPSQCSAMRHAAAVAVAKARACADLTPTQLTAISGWQLFFRDLQQSHVASDTLDTSLADRARTSGCGVLHDDSNGRGGSELSHLLCAEVHESSGKAARGSVQAFCPMACQMDCNASGSTLR